MRRISVADMRAFSSLAWVAMLRRLSVVFTTGVLLLRPCLAADSGESNGEKIARLLSPEMRRLDAERLALALALPALPPVPEPEFTQRLGWHSHFSTSADTVEWLDLRLAQPEALDAVVLIAPACGGSGTAPGYGFPLRFRVEIAGAASDAERVIIADKRMRTFPRDHRTARIEKLWLTASDEAGTLQRVTVPGGWRRR